MQQKENLEALLDAVLRARDEVKTKRIPVLLKVSPDLSPSERKDVVGVITKSEVYKNRASHPQCENGEFYHIYMI